MYIRMKRKKGIASIRIFGKKDPSLLLDGTALLIAALADRYHVEPDQLIDTLIYEINRNRPFIV